jgi:hypothetical protein
MMNLKRITKRLGIIFIVIVWFATGWPVVWLNPRIPPKILGADAATQTFVTSGQWQAPTDVTSVTVETWGGGGAGGGRGTSNGQSGGGGGGAYAKAVISVTPGNTYNYTVGTAVSGGTGNGTDGNPSFWDTGTQIKAAGGKGGVSTTTKGLGGAVASSAGTTINKGGDGADGATVSGGGGGGGGSTGAGGNATNGTAGTGTTIGGGNGGAGVSNADGNPGSSAGGGGSGARRTNGSRSGGGGAVGQIKITYAIISVTVSDASIAYGTLATNTSKDTASSGINDTQVATNAGDAAEDFNIKGQSSANWTLAGSAGNEQYVHYFCISGSGSPDPCDASPTWTALTTSYQSLTTNIAASGTKRFDLKITTPTSTTATLQQSVTITIQVVVH